jgi:hypothetical protein
MLFILKRNFDSSNIADLEKIATQYGVSIVDRINDQAALIEANSEAVDLLQANLHGWVVTPEIEYEIPQPPFPRNMLKAELS